MAAILDMEVGSTKAKMSAACSTDSLVTSTPITIGDRESLIKLLECSACSKIPRPPVLLCENGHSTCSKCRSKMPSCTTCSENFTNTRNLLAEELIKKFASKCPYSKGGCTKMLYATEWNFHKANCNFRHVDCSLQGVKSCANVMVCYSNYLTHLKNVHGVTGVTGTVIKVQQNSDKLRAALETGVPYESWPLHYLEAFENVFLTGTEIQKGKIFWWISIIGTVQQANNFIGKILIENETLDTELSWSGPVVSFRWKPKQIISTGCLAATEDNFRLFTQEVKLPDSTEPAMSWNMTFSVFKRELKLQNSSIAHPANKIGITGSLGNLNIN